MISHPSTGNGLEIMNMIEFYSLISLFMYLDLDLFCSWMHSKSKRSQYTMASLENQYAENCWAAKMSLMLVHIISGISKLIIALSPFFVWTYFRQITYFLLHFVNKIPATLICSVQI